MNRRNFLSAALVGLTAKAERTITGSYVNESFTLGHRLRDGKSFPAAPQTKAIDVVIVGAGISGLSAAWWLKRKGFSQFVLLEMEKHAGGNARWGENAISRYPWAAHYVPVPNQESVYVRELFVELGIFSNNQWREESLCFNPKERLFLNGYWQDGLEPDSVLTRRDREQFRRFEHRMQEFRSSRAFTIPMALGSSTPHHYQELDSLSFTQWMEQEKFDSQYLKWYANYACRDDYGALARNTSAWAGIHYFAARAAEEKGPITAPEGNGWIVERLVQKLSPFLHPETVVYRMTRQGRKWKVSTPQCDYVAETVIFAAPSFLAGYLSSEIPKTHTIVYSPWFTANLSLNQLPREEGIERAWDNVIFDSRSLGYVDATHMTLRTFIDRAVWTYYWSLAEYQPAEGRRILLERTWKDWKEIILGDLERAHPDIRQCVSHIDMMRMGHAMARPTPGFLTSPERLSLCQGQDGFFFANSDLSGFSIFEEAQYRGIVAAESTLRRHGHS